MFTIPAPPPLPQIPVSSIGYISKHDINSTNLEQIATNANEFKEMREACAKFDIYPDSSFKYSYKHTTAILQEGPTCGLVALSILLNGKVNCQEILNIAKTEGYSNNGEMFSCKNMLQLSRKVLCLSKINDLYSYNVQGDLFSDMIVEKLLNGALLLVPYDADFNHAPCLKKGHKAHWALICGVILVNDPGLCYTSDPSNVFVFCRHGKSKHLGVWNLAELDKSNKNLVEFSPQREGDNLIYVLPEDGIGGDNGLKNQFIVFEEH